MKVTNEVWQYRLESDNSGYSGFFKTKDEAIAWYNRHGKWLEKMFNRKLTLKNELETRWTIRQKNAIDKERQREELKLKKQQENGSRKSKKNI